MLLPDRWLWLGLSFLLAVTTTQLTWYFQHWSRGRLWTERLAAAGVLDPLIHLVRFLYYVGVPFGALLWGREAILERAFGLWPFPYVFGVPATADDVLLMWTQWVRGIGWVVFLGVTFWGVLVLSGWRARACGQETIRMGLGASLREAVFHETHWMFYRNGPVVVLGPYWGTWAGLGIVLLEASLNPWWRRALGEPGLRPLTLLRVAMAPLSALLYLQVSNLWLAILLHWGVTWGAITWMNRTARHRTPQTTSTSNSLGVNEPFTNTNLSQ